MITTGAVGDCDNDMTGGNKLTGISAYGCVLFPFQKHVFLKKQSNRRKTTDVNLHLNEHILIFPFCIDIPGLLVIKSVHY